MNIILPKNSDIQYALLDFRSELSATQFDRENLYSEDFLDIINLSHNKYYEKKCPYNFSSYVFPVKKSDLITNCKKDTIPNYEEIVSYVTNWDKPFSKICSKFERKCHELQKIKSQAAKLRILNLENKLDVMYNCRKEINIIPFYAKENELLLVKEKFFDRTQLLGVCIRQENYTFSNDNNLDNLITSIIKIQPMFLGFDKDYFDQEIKQK